MSVLDSIIEGVREDLAARRLPMSELLEALEVAPPVRDCLSALLTEDISVIAEVKRSSPSKGALAPIADPAGLASMYQEAGASVISVLTEQRRFGGTLADLDLVRRAVDLPILRKDFMVDEYQIYEAKLIGADCILLIASILNDNEIQSFADLAESLELDYLIEVHDLKELKRVEHFSNAMIGVNNRNLKTFDVDLNNSINLKKAFNGNNLFVAESGIKSQDDIDTLKAHDIHVFLIGESLMKGDFA